MLYGLLNLSFWGYVLATFVMIQISYACITLYLHRCQAHRALTLHPIVSHFCRLWLWLSTGMTTKNWVAIHRKHHARCETAEDPHSPQVLGIKKVLLEGAELYRKEGKNKDTLSRFGQGTPDDWIENKLYSRYSALGLGIMFVLDIVLFGIPGITIWAFQMMATPVGAAGIINGIGHYWGYRNFECPDAARNVIPWGLFLAGEELHNNHHTYATSAKFSVKWWEIDLGWFYISVLRALGLAKVKRVPPRLEQNLAKSTIDVDTLTAVVLNRFQVLSQYSRDVILPVLQEEQRKASDAGRDMFKRARAKVLLVRTESLLNESHKQAIARILENSQSLKLVYQFRLKLQDIWSRTTASQRELLEALEQWRLDAEATGIATLRNFAQRLSSFTSQKVVA